MNDNKYKMRTMDAFIDDKLRVLLRSNQTAGRPTIQTQSPRFSQESRRLRCSACGQRAMCLTLTFPARFFLLAGQSPFLADLFIFLEFVLSFVSVTSLVHRGTSVEIADRSSACSLSSALESCSYLCRLCHWQPPSCH